VGLLVTHAANSSPCAAADAHRLWPRRWPIWLVLVGGVGVSLGGFLAVRNLEQRAAAARFEQDSEATLALLQRNVQQTMQALESVGVFYSASQSVDRGEFGAFVRPYLSRYPGILALGWAPRVPTDQRLQYEQAAQREGLAGFRIAERGPNGQMVPAAAWPEYFPVLFLEPTEERPVLLGYNLRADPHYRQALELCWDTGKAIATSPVAHAAVAGADEEGMFAVFWPIYRGGNAGGSSPRREALQGFAVGWFRTDRLVDQALEGQRVQGIDLAVFDPQSPGRRLLHFHPSSSAGRHGPAGGPEAEPDVTVRKSNPWQEASLEVGARNWSVLFLPTPDYLRSLATWQPWGVLLTGLVLTALLVAYLWTAIGHTTRVERLVAQRTAELSQANRTLQIEVRERVRAEAVLQEANQKLARSLAELERGRREADLLRELSELLESCQNPDEAYEVIGRVAPRIFADHAGFLGMISASRNIVEAMLTWGHHGFGERVFIPEDCWALRRGRAYAVSGSTVGLACRHLRSAELEFSLCVPMMAQGEALGLLHLHPLEAAAAPSEPDCEALARRTVTLAERIALALANLKLRDKLRQQSIRDPLTGLFNRRYLEESLERELRRAIRKQQPLGLILFDIDHFKRFNDTFGHEAGDTLLKELGNWLQGRTRAEDIVCRYGGEEFTFVLIEANLESTRRVAQKLCEEVRHLHVEHRGQSISSITLSLGVAAYPEHGDTADALLRAADGALYRAKANGRNRVEAAEPLEQPAAAGPGQPGAADPEQKPAGTRLHT